MAKKGVFTSGFIRDSDDLGARRAIEVGVTQKQLLGLLTGDVVIDENVFPEDVMIVGGRWDTNDKQFLLELESRSEKFPVTYAGNVLYRVSLLTKDHIPPYRRWR